MIQILEKVRNLTSLLGFLWPVVFIPIWQEILFRYLPYKFFYQVYGHFWEIGIITNLVFAGIHWYLGRWFILWAFFWGIFLWWVMGKYGIAVAILIHALINIIDLHFGTRGLLQKLP